MPKKLRGIVMMLQKHTPQHDLTFKKKHSIACNKAYRFVADWVKENNKDCNEIYFDKGIVSPEKDVISYNIRAIEQYLRRAHLFELRYNKNNLEISFLQTSQSPVDLEPGDIKVQIRPNW